jgi:Fe-S-cluster-containing hydrogenase component 2
VLTASDNKKGVEDFVFFPEKCTACMRCVLACSLHHTGSFSKTISSIRVGISLKERQIDITVHKRKNGIQRACDLCEAEEMPLCVSNCARNAILYRSK